MKMRMYRFTTHNDYNKYTRLISEYEIYKAIKQNENYLVSIEYVGDYWDDWDYDDVKNEDDN